MEESGKNSLSRSMQPPFALLEPQEEQRLTAIPDKIPRQQHVGQA